MQVRRPGHDRATRAVDLPAPIGDRWCEDYVAGSVYEFGHASLSEPEIVAFARHYDPQSSTPTRLVRRRDRSTG